MDKSLLYFLSLNSFNNSANFDATATDAITSVFSEVQSSTNNISDSWRIGDGAPVENAWKYSSTSLKGVISNVQTRVKYRGNYDISFMIPALFEVLDILSKTK